MGEKIVKLTPAQRFIAKKMKETVVNSPQATTCFDVDMGPVMALKEKLKAEGKNVTVAAFLVKAVALAVKENPKMNSRFINGEIHMYDEVNVAMAMAVPNGLIVPVIKNADTKDLVAISQDIKTLKEKVDAGKLGPEDMQGGTCSLTSLGNGRNDIVLPIVNDDITLLLGAGSTHKKPVVLDDDTIGIKNIANFSCNTNHCVMYGAEVGKFCTDFAEILENAEEKLK